jgi:hypothetical protein
VTQIILIGAFVVVMSMLIDFARPRRIAFRRLGSRYWEIARSDAELDAKLDGEVADVIMPARPLVVRLWRRLFPPRGKTVEVGQ